MDPCTGSMDESKLLKAIGVGDETAFGEIYRRYHRQVYNYLYSIIRESSGTDDVLQEVFIGIWKGAARFQNKSSPKTWIYRIAYKQAMSWFRKHHKDMNMEKIEEKVDLDDNPEETAIATMQNHQVQKALEQLAPKHRAVLELAFIQAMSYSEIAEILECPIGTVKSRMSHALKSLNRQLIVVGYATDDDKARSG